MIRIRREYDMWFGDYEGTAGTSALEPIIKIVYETIGVPEWIKTEEELPEAGTDVWVNYPGSSQGARAHLMTEEEKQKQSVIRRQIDNNYEGNWWHDPEMFFPRNDITHWMELPKLPKI